LYDVVPIDAVLLAAADRLPLLRRFFGSQMRIVALVSLFSRPVLRASPPKLTEPVCAESADT
jgi:hypothetical protein